MPNDQIWVVNSDGGSHQQLADEGGAA